MTAERPRPTAKERAHARRSEEHTSELQSRQYLVCRLLLEKKNDLETRHAEPGRGDARQGEPCDAFRRERRQGRRVRRFDQFDQHPYDLDLQAITAIATHIR